MKKRCITLFLCLVLLVGVLPLSAAADTLAKPTNLKWDITGTTATWDPVPNAQTYSLDLDIECDDGSIESVVFCKVIDASRCSYTFSEIEPGKSYYFSVRAQADGYKNSATQASGLNTDHKAQNLTISNLEWKFSGKVATWDPVPNAKSYVASLYRSQDFSNGTIVTRKTVTTCQCNFSDNIASDETYYFVVTASVDGYEPAEILGQSPLNKLPVLTNLKWDGSGTVASWDPLPGASCYFVGIAESGSDGSDESIYEGSLTMVYDCQYDFSEEMDPKKTYYFVVYAILEGQADAGCDIDDIAAKSGLNKAPKLPTPTNLKCRLSENQEKTA